MAHQSPMISIPKKSTDEVDWTTPIRTAITQSYGENPDNYASECSALQRCRQDAVRGAGSDMTGMHICSYRGYFMSGYLRSSGSPLQVLRAARTARAAVPR